MNLSEQHEKVKRAARRDDQIERLEQLWYSIKSIAFDAGYVVTDFDVEFEGDREVIIRMRPA